MEQHSILIYILIAIVITNLIRVTPMILIKGQIKKGQRIFPVGEACLIKNKVVPLHHGTNQTASCHPSRCADRQL